MAAKGYTTEAKVAHYLGGITIPSGDADFYIESAETLIDQQTGRNFIADNLATQRVFSGDGSNTLQIDDCVEVSVVERGLDAYADSKETITAGGSSGYRLVPANNLVDIVPITLVHLRTKNWICGLQNNFITAKWGYSINVPSDISMVATIIAAMLYQYNRNGASGNIKSEKIGNYAISYKEDKELIELEKVKAILLKYRKINI